MKAGLAAIIVLAAASVATHFMLADNGYVLINFRGYAIEMSVPILLFLLILAYVGVRLLVRIWRAPRDLGEAVAGARARRAGRLVSRGFAALSEGKIAKGERLLTRGARDSDTPLLSYLAAARAAQMQGDLERRDGWLRMAYEQGKETNNAVLLTQAELQLDDGEVEQALASLNRVRETQPRHPQALRLLARLHGLREEWHELAALLGDLRRQRAVAAEQLESWTAAAYTGLLQQPGLDVHRIEALWLELPRQQRSAGPLLHARVRALLAAGADEKAESEIRKALKSGWDAELVLAYGELKGGDAAAQLRQAERWLRDRPEDPALLLTAGRVCIRNQLWGKARSYLESSLAIRPSPTAYDALGQLMLKIGEEASATAAFRKGLTLAYAGTPDLPQLESKS